MAAPYIQTVKEARLKDRDWIKKSFLMSSNRLNKEIEFYRYFSSVRGKFTNSTLGGNFPINSLPQYTRYADVRSPDLRSKTADGRYDLSFSDRMGRFHSEQIDDNQELITLQFGMPKYKGWLTFFTGFFDQEASVLANQGRLNWISRTAYLAGKVAGVIGAVVAMSMAPYLMLGYIGSYFLNRSTSKYYTLKPTMELYWNRVNFIANSIAANMGIIERPYNFQNIPEELSVGVEANEQRVPNEMIERAHKLAPDIFLKSGGIDVYNIATKPQRMANQQYLKTIQKNFGDTDSKAELKRDWARYFSDTMGQIVDDGGMLDPTTGRRGGIDQALEWYHNSILGNMEAEQYNISKNFTYEPVTSDTDVANLPDVDNVQDNTGAGQLSDDEIRAAGGGTAQDIAATDGWLRPVWERLSTGDAQGAYQLLFPKNTFSQQIAAVLQNGNQWCSFKVDWSGEVSESFDNSITESDVSQKLNGAAGGARSARFDFSDGKTGLGVVDQAFDAVKSFATGALDGIQLSGLMALAGSAYVDIPKRWDNSSANLQTMSYTIKLRSLYGHPLSRLTDIYVPLSMILAGVLPISTGKQSYTSPFLCQVFNRAKAFSRLAMITSVNITRGTGNMGFNNNNEALGVDVSITFTDMSSLYHAPIDTNLGGIMGGLFDDDNAFNDYLATLGNMSLDDQIYAWRKLSLRLAKKNHFLRNYFNPSRIANTVSGFGIVRALSGIAPVDYRSQL